MFITLNIGNTFYTKQQYLKDTVGNINIIKNKKLTVVQTTEGTGRRLSMDTEKKGNILEVPYHKQLLRYKEPNYNKQKHIHGCTVRSALKWDTGAASQSNHSQDWQTLSDTNANSCLTYTTVTPIILIKPTLRYLWKRFIVFFVDFKLHKENVS